MLKKVIAIFKSIQYFWKRYIDRRLSPNFPFIGEAINIEILDYESYNKVTLPVKIEKIKNRYITILCKINFPENFDNNGKIYFSAEIPHTTDGVLKNEILRFETNIKFKEKISRNIALIKLVD